MQILQNGHFVEPGVTYFQGVLRGVSVSEEMAESGENPGDPSAPGKEALLGSGGPSLSGPRRGTRPARPGQAGRVKILQKAAVDPIRGSGISSSLSLISVICYLLSRPDAGVTKIIPLRPTPAYPSYGRCAVCQPVDSHSLCRPRPTVPHAPTSDFLVAPVLPRIPDPPLGSFNVK